MSNTLRHKRWSLYYKMGQQRCAGPCGKWLPYDMTTVDHRMPRAHGGGSEYANLQIMCSPCNARKGDTYCAA